MKHPSIRELFDYWNERRGLRPAPDRADIEPVAIRRVLADTFILAVAPRAGHPFRVAGTRVCALFGRELKGSPFLGLWSAGSRPEVRDLLAVVAGESAAVVAGAAAEPPLEMILLPLGAPEREPRILGALVPREPPARFGGLGGLTLGPYRYVGAAQVADPPRRHHAAMPRGRFHRGLVVYDGGRS
jgi:hypothetical protein